jgi:hypothetical protein
VAALIEADKAADVSALSSSSAKLGKQLLITGHAEAALILKTINFKV